MVTPSNMTDFFKRKGGSRLSNFTSSLSLRVRSNVDPSESSNGINVSRIRAGLGEWRGVRGSRVSRASRANRSRRNGNAVEPQQQRTRLRQGWWPAGEIKKRGEILLTAMEALKEETFVVTEGHFEWVFDEEIEAPQDDEQRDESEQNGMTLEEKAVEPQCYLVLPMEKGHCGTVIPGSTCNDCCESANTSSGKFNHCSGRTTNECAICMLEYDVGDVVVYSKRCGHAFHQECVLDWFSREKSRCPSCRSVFWEPDQGKINTDVSADNSGGVENASSESAPNANESTEDIEPSNPTSRARIDTEETVNDTTSLRSSTDLSFDESEQNALSSEVNASSQSMAVSCC